jgi:hypothetical protein
MTKRSLSLSFSNQNPVCIFFCINVPHALPISSSTGAYAFRTTVSHHTTLSTMNKVYCFNGWYSSFKYKIFCTYLMILMSLFTVRGTILSWFSAIWPPVLLLNLTHTMLLMSQLFSINLTSKNSCFPIPNVMSIFRFLGLLLLLLLLMLQPWVGLGLFNSSTLLLSILYLCPPTSNLHPL